MSGLNDQWQRRSRSLRPLLIAFAFLVVSTLLLGFSAYLRYDANRLLQAARPSTDATPSSQDNVAIAWPPLSQHFEDVAALLATAKSKNVDIKDISYQIETLPSPLEGRQLQVQVVDSYGNVRGFAAAALGQLSHLQLKGLRLDAETGERGAVRAGITFLLTYRRTEGE